MRRKWALLGCMAMLGLVLTACGGSGSSTGGGTPVKGGTLTMLGTGDVDYMDPNVSYYTTGYLALRMWARQLLTYPAIAGQVTDVVPDLATDVPSTSNGGISADGLTYKLTIQTGAMWDTNPPRQVTAADAVRGLERTCNPAQPFGGLPDFETLIAGHAGVLRRLRQGVADRRRHQDVHRLAHSISGVTVDPTNPADGRLPSDPPGHLLPQSAGHAGLLARPGRVPQLPARQ